MQATGPSRSSQRSRSLCWWGRGCPPPCPAWWRTRLGAICGKNGRNWHYVLNIFENVLFMLQVYYLYDHFNIGQILTRAPGGRVQVEQGRQAGGDVGGQVRAAGGHRGGRLQPHHSRHRPEDRRRPVAVPGQCSQCCLYQKLLLDPRAIMSVHTYTCK